MRSVEGLRPVSREDIVTALLSAATKLGPVSLRLRGRGWPAVAADLDVLASDLARAARGGADPIATARKTVDTLRARATFLRTRAQPLAAAELTSILRDLGTVADAELGDTQVGIPVDDSDTFVLDDPPPKPEG